MKCHGAYKTNTSSQKKTPLKMTNRLYAAETKAALVALYITLSCSRPPLTLKSNPGLLTVSWDDVCLSSIQTIRADISIMFSPRGAAVHPKTRLQSKVRMLLNTAGMCQVNTIYHLSGHCSITASVHLLALFCADQKITCWAFWTCRHATVMLTSEDFGDNWTFSGHWSFLWSGSVYPPAGVIDEFS